MLLFKRKKDANKKKRFSLSPGATRDIRDMIEKESVEEVYTMEKTLIIEAWSKYRPDNIDVPKSEGHSPKTPKSPRRRATIA